MAAGMTVLCDAVLSPNGRYRFELRRQWSEARPVTWVMLNPSTADAEEDDPTIRRCVGFARRWGYGGIRVVNLFGLRATDPMELHSHPDPVGWPDNEVFVHRAVAEAPMVVVGWGAWPGAAPGGLRCPNVLPAASAAGVPVMCLGKTRSGAPRHPLYISYDEPLVPWPGWPTGSPTGGRTSVSLHRS